MAGKKFLQRVSLDAARDTVRRLARPTDTEVVASEDAGARVTAAPVFATTPSPHYRASAMDGIAVRALETAGASADEPVMLVVADTDPPGTGISSCRPVDTGSPLPSWADSVVRIEDTNAVDGGFLVRSPVSPGRDVRAIGEDVARGALLFGRGHRIRPYDIGAMLATGVLQLPVRKRPSIAVIATGTEIVEPGEPAAPGRIIEFNSRMLSAYLDEWGGQAAYLGRVADDPGTMRTKLLDAAAAHDAVCVIAGSSVGRKDFTVDVLRDCGEVLVHGIDVMPGKPASVARVGATPVVGIPGYPVSAAVTYMELVAPLVAAMLGTTMAERPIVEAIARRKIPSRLGVEEFLRVCLSRNGRDLVVAPLPRGAGSITTLVRADALLRIPATSEGIDRDTRVRVELLPSSEPGDTVVVAGLPDLLSATVEDRLRSRGLFVRFAHLGFAAYDSMVALRNGEAHIAVFECTSRKQGEELDELEESYLPGAKRVVVVEPTSSKVHRVLVTETFSTTVNGTAVLSELESGNGRSTSQA